MSKKIALFAFNGELCFIHVLLYSLDFADSEYDVKLIIEGTATKEIVKLKNPLNPMHKLYKKVKDAGLIDCVCKACANKMGALEAAKEEGLRIEDEMSGHPSMARYRNEGYEIIVY